MLAEGCILTPRPREAPTITYEGMAVNSGCELDLLEVFNCDRLAGIWGSNLLEFKYKTNEQKQLLFKSLSCNELQSERHLGTYIYPKLMLEPYSITNQTRQDEIIVIQNTPL